MRCVPNLLSAGRIELAFLLCINQQPLFFVCDLLCGLTDVLDGFLARKCQAVTAFGAKLDSLGDAVFWLIVLVLLYTQTEVHTLWILAGMALIVGIRFFNLIVTKVKFHHWAVLHSGAIRSPALPYFSVLLGFAFHTVPLYVLGTVFGFALLTSVEELIILCRSSDYEPNTRGLFHPTRPE